ncbi:MAG: CRTAC1 family protein [Chitinophagales bacterium]|nr:CRTAC1 family protein [Chitinophagales bacterium]
MEKIQKLTLLVLFNIIFFYSKGQAQTKLFDIIKGNELGVNFINKVTETENENIFVKGLLYFNAGAGVAVGDINNDMLPDIFFAGNQNSSKLFLNLGNFKFKDVSKQYNINTTTWCTGTYMVDVNNDGWLDIYVLKTQNNTPLTGGNLLFINYNGKYFKEESEKYKLNLNDRFLAGTFIDYDNDGDLDLYLAKYPDNSKTGNSLNFDFNLTYPKEFGNDIFLENTDKGFINISNKVNIHKENGFGISVTSADINLDGFQDIYVGNDFAENDFLYINNKNKTFTDKIKEKTIHTSLFTMGVDINDVNNDLLPDILSLDMNPEELSKYKMDFGGFDFNIYEQTKNNYNKQEIRNCLQLQNTDGTFSDIGQLDKIAFTDWSWSPLIADFDLDGYKDIFISNGQKKDVLNQDIYMYKLDSIASTLENGWEGITNLKTLELVPDAQLHNYLFKNINGLNFQKSNTTWLNSIPSKSTGAAYADFDLDGDIDIVTNELDDYPLFYRNNSNILLNKKYLEITPYYQSNIAFGCYAFLFYKDKKIYTNLLTSRGFMSSSQSFLHFGLDTSIVNIDSLKIYYNNTEYSYYNLKPNQIIKLDLNKCNNINIQNTPVKPKINFVKLDTFPYVNQNYYELMRNNMLFQTDNISQPLANKYDVDNDKTEELIICNKEKITFYKINVGDTLNKVLEFSLNLSPKYFISDFKLAIQNNKKYIILSLNTLENNQYSDSLNYLRSYEILYTNNTFSLHLDTTFLPHINFPLTTFEINTNLDTLLIAEGAFETKAYKQNIQLYTKYNKKWIEQDLSKNLLSKYKLNHNIKKLFFYDVNNDNKKDIVISGFYLPIFAILNTNNQFDSIYIIDSALGFWNNIKYIKDNTNDSMYLFKLNIGENFRFNLKSEKEIKLYINNFNRNNKNNLIYCTNINNSDFPIYNFKDFSTKFPDTRKNAYSPLKYANLNINKIFNDEKMIDTSVVYTINNTQSKINNNIYKELQTTQLNDVLFNENTQTYIFAGNNYNLRHDLGYIDNASIIIANKSFTSFNTYNYIQDQITQLISIKNSIYCIGYQGVYRINL